MPQITQGTQLADAAAGCAGYAGRRMTMVGSAVPGSELIWRVAVTSEGSDLGRMLGDHHARLVDRDLHARLRRVRRGLLSDNRVVSELLELFDFGR